MDENILFSPVTISGVTIKNRFVMAPMSVHMTDDGIITEDEIAYMERRARGGVGMIIVGSVCVRPDGNFGGQLFLDKDERVEELRRLTEAVHRHDCLISAQIHHAGRETNKATSGYQPVAPSYFEPEVYAGFKAEYDPPHVLTTEEVRELVEQYAQAVRRARDAGFDMVELHCAHGYLICAFMSPLTNQRDDAYGGCFLNRMRFVTEIVERSRELVGPAYPITARIVGDELREGGIDMAMSLRIARHLEKIGIDALSVSAGMYPYVRTVANMYHKPGVNLYLAENIRQGVNIPVMAAGQLDRPQLQKEAVMLGKTDIVCLGRTLIADPDYPEKLRQGREEEVIWCIACNKGCHDRTAEDRRVHCALNVQTGRENDAAFRLMPAEKSKKVMVIGGGPAGLEAARVCALRGHAVSLYEQGDRLGGRLRLAAVPPHKSRYGEACDYLERAVRRLGVEIHLNEKATLETMRGVRPDAVILATGSLPFVPPIPGLAAARYVIADDILNGSVVAGEHVAVIGGGSVGAETAHHLVEQAPRHVEIIEMRDGIGLDMPQDSRICLLKEFAMTENLTVHAPARVTGVSDTSLEMDVNGETRKIEHIDTIVLAVGARPNVALMEGMADESWEVCAVGDAGRPGDYVKAIREGHICALRI